MLEKDHSETDLTKLSYKCLVFKKYYQYDLWLGNYSEYYNLQYCKKYTQKYLYYLTHTFLLKNFDIFFVGLLYKSPSFIRFIKSGFLIYLDYHFLVLFYYSCSNFGRKAEKEIKSFVKLYFHFFLKKRFEKDLFDLINEAMYETVLLDNSEVLIKRFEDIYVLPDETLINDEVFSKLVVVQNKILCIERFLLFYLKKKTYCSVRFNGLNNLLKANYFFSSLEFVYKSPSKVLNSFSNLIELDELVINKTFIDSLEEEETDILEEEKETDILEEEEETDILEEEEEEMDYFDNNDISVYDIVKFIDETYKHDNKNKEKQIGFYKNFNIISKNLLTHKKSLPENDLKKFLNSFDNCFLEHGHNKDLFSL